MPVPMMVKKKYKQRIQSEYSCHVTSNTTWTIQRRKAWQHVKERLRDVFRHLTPWHQSIRNIEGQYGTSIASYFVFIRWLLFANIFIFFVLLIFVVMPQVFGKVKLSAYDPVVYKCTKKYEAELLSYQTFNYNGTAILEYIQDFLQGSGWMENTPMFMGNYTHMMVDVGFSYNLPLAYMTTYLVFLFLSLILMLKSSAKGIKESVITAEGQLYKFCDTAFAGWDFCIRKEKAAELKKAMLHKELKSCKEDHEFAAANRKRTKEEKAKLYLMRTVINIIVLAMLVAGGIAIYYASYYTLEKAYGNADNTNTSIKSSTIIELLIEYLPSLVLSSLNIILPMIFYELVVFEKYSPTFVIKMNLLRTVVLRLASIAVFLVFFATEIESIKNREKCGDRLRCWETYIGQQLYKLVLLQFILVMVSTFIIGFLRKILTTKVKWRIFEWLGQEQFDIPKHVLDLVYVQSLCWLGAFFSPLLPVACILKFFFYFYIKKFHLSINCVPSDQPYRASRSNFFFLVVLLISFCTITVIPVAFTMAKLLPSRSCSPFRSYDMMWQVVTLTIDQWPSKLGLILNLLGSTAFATTIIILLLLFIYYYHTLAVAYTKMTEVLKERLVMEERDKQFLLKRFIRLCQPEQLQSGQSRRRSSEGGNLNQRRRSSGINHSGPSSMTNGYSSYF